MLGIIALHLLWFQTRMVMMAPVDHVQLVIIAMQAQRHPLNVQKVHLRLVLGRMSVCLALLANIVHLLARAIK